MKLMHKIINFFRSCTSGEIWALVIMLALWTAIAATALIYFQQ